MINERGVVRRIVWHELFPWLIILRTFRLGISPTHLALATLALLILPVGRIAGGWIFLPKTENEGRWHVQWPESQSPSLTAQVPGAVREYLPNSANGIFKAYDELAEPIRRLFQLRLTIREAAYYAFISLWSLAIWAFVGGFITRRAVVKLATDETPGVKETLSYCCRRYHWYALAPIYPLLGIFLVVFPIALLGIPLRFDLTAGSALAALFWVFVLLASVAAAWLVGGLIFGWPLMWPTVSAERDGDPFEAFSRSYSYVYGRPLHYLFYVIVAALFGAICLAVVEIAATLVIEFGFWALSWGAGPRASELRDLVNGTLSGYPPDAEQNATLALGVTLISLLVRFVQRVVEAFVFSFFFCVASAIYLLLRLDTDEKELDEVYLEERRPIEQAKTAPPVTVPPVASAPPTEVIGNETPPPERPPSPVE